MALILIIDAVVVATLAFIALTKGVEAALPFFVFVVVLLPWQCVFPIPGVMTVTGQRVAIVTLIALFLVFKPPANRSRALLSTPLKFLLMLQIGWCVLSTANSIVPVDSLKKMSFEVVEYYLMYYILVRTISGVKTIHRMMGAMVFAVLVACVFGSFEAYTGWRVTSLFPYVAGRFTGVAGFTQDSRYFSTFAEPSLFGAAISFAIVEALYLLTLAKKTGRKVYLWVALLVMFLNIYKIVTRGPWLSLIIGLCLLVLVGDMATRRRIAALALLSVAVMVIRPGVYDTVKDLYLATTDTSNPNDIKADSFEYRFALRRVAQQELDKSFPREMWGYGPGSFYYLHIVAPFEGNPAYPFESCDSSWVQLMVETGYVGLLIIALLLIKPAVLAFRDWRKILRPEGYLCGILFINMLQYFFMMTNVALYAWGQTAYMLWIWIAISMVYRRVWKEGIAEAYGAPAAEASKEFELLPAPGF